MSRRKYSSHCLTVCNEWTIWIIGTSKANCLEVREAEWKKWKTKHYCPFCCLHTYIWAGSYGSKVLSPAGSPPGSPAPEPPPARALPGAGGLFKFSFTFLHNSSSLSALGSWVYSQVITEYAKHQGVQFFRLTSKQSYTDGPTCIQKNILLLLVLNLRTNTLPVVQAGTALNSTSSGKMIRSSWRFGWD